MIFKKDQIIDVIEIIEENEVNTNEISIRKNAMDELEQIGIVFNGNDGIKEVLIKHDFKQLELAETKYEIHKSLTKFDVTPATLTFVKKYMDIKLNYPNINSWMLESLIDTNSLHLINKTWLVSTSVKPYIAATSVYGNDDINNVNKFISDVLMKYYSIVNITKDGKSIERKFQIAGE